MQIDKINIPENDRKRPLEKRNSFQKEYLKRLDFVEENAFSGGPKSRKGLKLALWTWASAAVDHLIISSTTCFFLLIAIVILNSSLKNIGFSIFSIYAAISVSYFILFRVFLGATLGEYSCSLRLGEPVQRLKMNYSFRIFIRTISIMGTGIITLPLLSLIFKKDLPGSISGVSIYSLK